jgi:hypothetical protein
MSEHKSNRVFSGLNPFLSVHPFLQFLTHLEKRQLLRCNLNLLSGFRVSAGISTVFFYEKGTKTSDFNPFPLCKCLGNFVENRLMTASASDLDKWFDSFSAWMRSILFIR